MIILKTQNAIIEQIIEVKSAGKTIGFVPTMGALHQGHLALVKKCVAENDVAIVSIFVNPTQFNNADDLACYPRNLDADAALLENAGCKIVFAPNVNEIYNEQEIKKPFEFDFQGLDTVMEGVFRPNHFNGVVQIVSKLFLLVQPDRAYFGEKDFQQLAIIRLMTKTLNFPVKIVGCPIIREESGLAFSSRNALLTEKEREIAAHIYAVLTESKTFFNHTSVEELKSCVTAAIERKEPLKVEYFEIIDGNTLQNIEKWENSDYIIGCLTVYCGKVRLIDNIKYV
ncbi:MAG: pantoate--beta-alanine ligase [Prevotellaceae bacterium]|jgi:pantoate--beta-alanine ligase|nr:pantoate--beta-alanine ligase [Prevotellaceae bacterium]